MAPPGKTTRIGLHGKQAADDRVERSLYTRANGFRYTAQKVIVDGPPDKRTTMIVEYQEYVKPDTTAQIFFLKNRRPDRWRDVQNIDAQHGHYIISERPLTEAEWIRAHASNAADLDLLPVSPR